jgi:general nucleoside transport system ATP-binding protein
MKAIELKSITKHFDNTIANDSIDFDLYQGEIHAILGENGAGKSTLMNILSGLFQFDSGKILVNGQEVHFKSPKDAIKMGIGMVYQHFMLIHSHTVFDNIILGTKLPFFLRRDKLKKPTSELFHRLNSKIDLEARISDLSIGEQQKVEIVKALYHGAKILILDEPTSVLTPQETEDLFGILKTMKNEGYSIIFISHKLSEVLAIADRITVLRKGKLIDTIENSNVKAEQLASMMIGKELVPKDEFIKISNPKSNTILKMDNVTLYKHSHVMALDDVSLELYSGEIIGIAGVAGNGQLEFAEVITGFRKPNSGSISISGRDITGESIKKIIDMGVAYIPEDRIGVGSVQSLNLCDNLLLKCYDVFSFFNTSSIRSYSKELADRYDIIYSDLNSPVKHLSGGNLQKLIIARELRDIPKLLVAVCPTRGLDIIATDYLRRMIVNCRNNNSAILLVSEDLDELLAVSDRIAVIYNGKLNMMSVKDTHKISLAMTGH